MNDAQLFDPADPAARQGGRLNPPMPTLGEKIAAGRAARDDGIDRAQGGSPLRWSSAAWDAARAVAATLPEWTTDDIWQALDDMGSPPPPEPRAMGALLRRVNRERLAVPTDRTRLSVRPECHRRPVRVWRSL